MTNRACCTLYVNYHKTNAGRIPPWTLKHIHYFICSNSLDIWTYPLKFQIFLAAFVSGSCFQIDNSHSDVVCVHLIYRDDEAEHFAKRAQDMYNQFRDKAAVSRSMTVCYSA